MQQRLIMRDSKTRRSGGLSLSGIALLALLPFFFPVISVSPQTRPSYKEVQEKLASLWASRYPLSPSSMQADPEKKGVLAANDGGRIVYYYRFLIHLPLPVRDEKGNLSSKGERKMELWVRYRSWENDPYDLSFVRIDRLPGTEKRWVK